MNRIIAVVFGVLAVAGATAAYGQERNPQMPSASDIIGPVSGGIESERSDRQSLPLFTFGGLEVRVWAPVEPHYSSEANRNLADQPFWGAG